MSKSDWVWMPHAGHFILGNYCGFKLATYVNGFIVSTVGELWLDRDIRRINCELEAPDLLKYRGDQFDFEYQKKFGFEEIGCDRKYETMVFFARKREEVCCCPWRADFGHDYDYHLPSQGYNDSGEAYKGHIKICEEMDAVTDREVFRARDN